jgi:DNA-binding transcriptional regulator YdaS (Cro superfamily)
MARDETSRAKARKQKLEEAIKIAGSAAKLSKLCGISASEISQMRNPDHPRNVGDVAAEKIETALSKTHGWMDQLHDDETTTSQVTPKIESASSYTSSRKADQVIKNIINSVNSGALSDDDIGLLGAMAQKIQKQHDPIDYSTHYPGLIDEDT